ncbi:hypothetical protein WJ438_22325 [Streptomyces sp. GD-15H]|uniref:hypothetical protein n=1 Tax=Streptomyces sp. GD-15H TaxID=3129112 RepID=UPI003247F2F2
MSRAQTVKHLLRPHTETFITQLITLAAVIFGGWIAVQVLGPSSPRGGTTVNIRKATFKRNHFHG